MVRATDCPEATAMGVKICQKDGKWYVFINHRGKRKAKCVGESKWAAEEVKRKLEAKLTLGNLSLRILSAFGTGPVTIWLQRRSRQR